MGGVMKRLLLILGVMAFLSNMAEDLGREPEDECQG
jgi:hypothetical protein